MRQSRNQKAIRLKRANKSKRTISGWRSRDNPAPHLLVAADLQLQWERQEARRQRRHPRPPEGRAEVENHLLEADAPTEARDADGKTPCELARANGHTSVATTLAGENSPADVAEKEASAAEDEKPGEESEEAKKQSDHGGPS